MAEYLACGNIMSDYVINPGTEVRSERHTGGPAFYALSGIKLWEDNVKLVTRTGADWTEDYEKWMDLNHISKESVKVDASNVSTYQLAYGSIAYQNPIFIMIGAMLVGLGSSMYQVQCPLLARSVIGNKHYSEIWAVMMVANSLIGGGLYSSIGLFYDKLGSYQGAFIMAAVLYIVALILGFIAIDMSRRKQKGKMVK